jgi:hypothetical protein
MTVRSIWLAPLTLSICLALGSAAPAGCSSSHADPSDAGTQEDVTGNITCTTDSRAQTYTANLEKMGTSGLVKFTLVKADPGPPVKGSDNTWTVQISDAAGQPMGDAEIAIKGIMPDHGHGWSTVPTITKNADGTFTFDKMNMFMHGIWNITFTVTTPSVTDFAVYSFCIE